MGVDGAPLGAVSSAPACAEANARSAVYATLTRVAVSAISAKRNEGALIGALITPVTLLGPVDDTIATESDLGPRPNAAIGLADHAGPLAIRAHFGVGVAVVALFDAGPNMPVSAAPEDTAAAAGVVFVVVAVVALFGTVDPRISAEERATIGDATLRIADRATGEAIFAVLGEGVAVIARLIASHDSIAARAERAVVITAIAVELVTIVTHFIARQLAIAASGDRAVVVALVIIDFVTVIAGLRTVSNPVSANCRLAGSELAILETRFAGRFSVFTRLTVRVGVITAFDARLNESISAAGSPTRLGAVILQVIVAVVALFGTVDATITTGEDDAQTDFTVRIAHGAERLTVLTGLGLGVPIVTLLAFGDDAIATAREGAIAVTRVTVDIIAVVALFVFALMSVSARGSSAVVVTFERILGVGGIALLVIGDPSVSTETTVEPDLATVGATDRARLRSIFALVPKPHAIVAAFDTVPDDPVATASAHATGEARVPDDIVAIVTVFFAVEDPVPTAYLDASPPLARLGAYLTRTFPMGTLFGDGVAIITFFALAIRVLGDDAITAGFEGAVAITVEPTFEVAEVAFFALVDDAIATPAADAIIGALIGIVVVPVVAMLGSIPNPIAAIGR